ncbi:Aconitate hydratase; mitochondrial [Camelus dromedarius]|uniref:Aconitate hydratase n=1 Tax=Camelus dromedarius TaxID=9838 RepID=A0A5N4CGJ1_CAMDR|nr:Aconitate hydratase; mitochondrial [Camelus dromedarius]
MARQELACRLKRKSQFTNALGSEQIYTTTEQNGYTQIRQEVDGLVLANIYIVTTLVIPGTLISNPEIDFLTGKDGRKFKLAASDGDELP